MKRLTLFVLAAVLMGCASREPKSEAPLRERFEDYAVRIHTVPEFIQAAEMREAGHQHARNAQKLLPLDYIIYEWDKAIECFGKAGDLYFEGKVKHPEFSEYADEELNLTYMFIRECVKERPFLINPIKSETLEAGEPTEEQKQKIQILREKIRQYEAAWRK